MKMKLQVYSAGIWATLNTRSVVGPQQIAETERELREQQSHWQSSYPQFKEAQFRIIKEK
jgi:hypothetical protein